MEVSDVFINNHVSGKLLKPDFGFEELKKINPRLIHVTISGFGSYDPYRKKPGYDITASAFGGLSSITGPKVSDSKESMDNLHLSRVGVRIILCVKSVQIRSFFRSVFSGIRTEYGEILSITVQMRENTDQKKLRIWTLFTQW